MNPLVATVIFGLAASLSWGSGDFSGGLASRRASVSNVVVADYIVGFLLMVTLALLTRETFPLPQDILWGALAGIAGVLGLLAFYSALASGKMGIAAPLSAVLTAGLPALFSAFTLGIPAPLQLVGFALALLAIGLIARPDGVKGSAWGIGLALLAGVGFGVFFILISRINPASTFWPIAVARLTSVILLLVIMRLRRQPVQPFKGVALLVTIAGILDSVGNAFFVLSAHSGRLDVAAVLSSLYPAATVLLAAILLRERVQRVQGVGVLLALVAIPLISAQAA
jgi:drug/metabolite transporter (DMT)-like permease